MRTSDLLATGDVAARLGISRRTVLQRVATGRLTPAGKLPGPRGAYLFDAEQIDYLTAYPDARPAPGGDVCGCPDDRCIGRHHDADTECPCAASLAADAAASETEAAR